MNEKMSIEERIVKSGLFYFDDGYLGSTNHGVGYYYGYGVEGINSIVDENGLMSLNLNREWAGDIYDEDEDGENLVTDWDGYFEKWFGDCDDFEIIEDYINGGNGYGKITVDKVNKSIKIMVVPCLYSDEDEGMKIFGFNNNGELVREVDEKQLNEILKDENYYIG